MNQNNVYAGSFLGDIGIKCMEANSNGTIDAQPDLQKWDRYVFQAYEELKTILLFRARNLDKPDHAIATGMCMMFNMFESNITTIEGYRKVMSDIRELIGLSALGSIESATNVSATNVSATNDHAIFSPDGDYSDMPELGPDVPNTYMLHKSAIEAQKIPMYRIPKILSQKDDISVADMYRVQMVRCCNGCKKDIPCAGISTECRCNNCDGEYDLCVACRSKGLSIDRCPRGYQCGRW